MKRIAELRPFADLLMIEMCTGSLAFLGNYRITLKELENIVHKAISKLETPRPLSKPKDLPKPSPYEKAKYKLKDCKLKLEDIKNQQKCANALKVYKAETNIRIRKKKRKLLGYLNHVAENRKSEPTTKRKYVNLSSDDDFDSDIRHHKEKAKRVRHDQPGFDDPNRFGEFK